MTPRLHRRRRALAAAIVVVAAMATPDIAQAHDSQDTWGYGTVYFGNGQCINALDKQNHGGALLSRYVETVSELAPNCAPPFIEDPGRIQQRGALYKAYAWGQPGTFCYQGGFVTNSTRSYDLIYSDNADIWPLCNYGPGVFVSITHDVDHWVWGVNTNGWLAASLRPATHHCHCP